MFRLFILFFIFIGFLVSCNEVNTVNKSEIIRTWKVDSALSFYNGFSHIQLEEGHDWGLCTFSSDSMMRESKFETYRSFYYGFKGEDSLFLSPTNTKDTVKFRIIKLSKGILALKMPKKPIFKSTGKQERFEIRYYSPTDLPIKKPKLLPGFKK